MPSAPPRHPPRRPSRRTPPVAEPITAPARAPMPPVAKAMRRCQLSSMLAHPVTQNDGGGRAEKLNVCACVLLEGRWPGGRASRPQPCRGFAYSATARCRHPAHAIVGPGVRCTIARWPISHGTGLFPLGAQRRLKAMGLASSSSGDCPEPGVPPPCGPENMVHHDGQQDHQRQQPLQLKSAPRSEHSCALH